MVDSGLDRRLIRRHFSAHADDYDALALVQSRVVARLAAAVAEAGGPPTGPLLDIGAGTGALLAAVANRWPVQPLVACDLAHRMCCHVRARLPAALVSSGDARSLPFHTGVFGTVMSASVFQWLEELAPVFGEVARLLRPGGLFACAFFGAGTLGELQQAWRQAGRECGREVALQNFHAEAGVRQALDPDDWTDPRLWRETETEWHADAATVLRRLKGIGAQNALRRPAGLPPRRLVTRALELYAAQWSGPQGVPASYQVQYLLARRR